MMPDKLTTPVHRSLEQEPWVVYIHSSRQDTITNPEQVILDVPAVLRDGTRP